MKVFVNVKQIGKKKGIEKKEYSLPSSPETVKELIEIFVETEVKRFNERAEGENLTAYLTSEEISDPAYVGKISYGEDYNKNKQSLPEATRNALQSYEDGIYRIFLNEEELGGLFEKVTLKEEDSLTFIRLTMLAGRMW